MAATPDMAPNRSASTATPARRRAASADGATRRSRAKAKEHNLEAQLSRLQDDIKAIGASVAHLAEEKVNEAKSVAKSEVKSLAKAGQQAVDDAQDEFGQLEKQIKDTIREKPLTAVAGAIALGFILAVVSR